MKVRIILFFLSLAISGTIIGCVQGSGGSAQQAQQSDQTSLSAEMEKVEVDQATIQHVRRHVHECGEHRLCVRVCHRPPGNPKNAVTLSLPLSAVKAHIHHGGKKHEEKDYIGDCVGSEKEVEDERDQVCGENVVQLKSSHHHSHENHGQGHDEDHGNCNQDDDQENEVAEVENDTPEICQIDTGDLGDNTSTDTTGDTTTTDTSTGTVVDVPLWCQPIYDRDKNCDGFDDVTGQALLQ